MEVLLLFLALAITPEWKTTVTQEVTLEVTQDGHIIGILDGQYIGYEDYRLQRRVSVVRNAWNGKVMSLVFQDPMDFGTVIINYPEYSLVDMQFYLDSFLDQIRYGMRPSKDFAAFRVEMDYYQKRKKYFTLTEPRVIKGEIILHFYTHNDILEFVR